MNTAIVAMLVNTKIPGFAERFALGFPVFTGDYKDFSLDWFESRQELFIMQIVTNFQVFERGQQSCHHVIYHVGSNLHTPNCDVAVATD
jgi:hypothetical protein